MNQTRYREVWDLEKLFPGGSQSIQFCEHIEQLEIKVDELEEKIEFFHTPLELNDSLHVADIIDQIIGIQLNLSQANSFITCLLAQNPKDQNAAILRGKTSSISARFESALQKTKKVLGNTNEYLWKHLLDTNRLNGYKFILNEWRENTENQLSETEESLVSNLMVDGYYAWGQFYNSLFSSIKVNISINGKKNELSVGQTINLRSHPD